MKPEVDYSTINMNELAKYPMYTKPPSYEISRSLGSACFLDAPGYPSYLTQDVYTSHGNSPAKGAVKLLMGRVIMRAEESYDCIYAKLRKLWNPLPYEHERVQCWIIAVYRHMRGCYSHPDYMDSNGHMKTLTGPSCYSQEFRTKSFTDDPRFSEEWRTQAKAEVEAYNAELQATWAKIAVPENHSAYLYVKKFYPEHEPNLEYIESLPKEPMGNWWELYACRPTPNDCPGETASWGNTHQARHPVNGSWCQVCGWSIQDLEAAS